MEVGEQLVAISCSSLYPVGPRDEFRVAACLAASTIFAQTASISAVISGWVIHFMNCVFRSPLVRVHNFVAHFEVWFHLIYCSVLNYFCTLGKKSFGDCEMGPG